MSYKSRPRKNLGLSFEVPFECSWQSRDNTSGEGQLLKFSADTLDGLRERKFVAVEYVHCTKIGMPLENFAKEDKS